MRTKVAFFAYFLFLLCSVYGYENDIVKEIECQELLEELQKNEEKKDSDKLATILFNTASVFSGRIIIPTGFRGNLSEEEAKLLRVKLQSCGFEVEP